MTETKNCRNCAHCEKNSLSASYDYCVLCGKDCSFVRQFGYSPCDKSLSGWTPRTFSQNLADNRFSLAIIGSLILFAILANINS